MTSNACVHGMSQTTWAAAEVSDTSGADGDQVNGGSLKDLHLCVKAPECPAGRVRISERGPCFEPRITEMTCDMWVRR